MNALTASRREVLGATSALLGMALAPRARGATPAARASFILDARLPEAGALTARARGHLIADPHGEIIRLLLGPQGKTLISAGAIIGLTTYTDFMLASDVLRGIGRAPRQPLALPLAKTDAENTPLLALLHESCQRRCASLATSYLWLA